MKNILITLFIFSFCVKAANEKFSISPPKQVQEKTLDLFKTVEEHHKIIFYTLDPSWENKGKFRGWKVLGKSEITDTKTKKLLLTNLYKAIESNDGFVAGCFNPRHSLKIISKNKTIDLVICFECASTNIYSGKQKANFLINGSPKVFNQIAKELKLETKKR